MKRLGLIWILAICFAGTWPLLAGAIHDAAAAGDLEKVRSLVQADPALANERAMGTTPLHQAARNGHLKVVEFLVAAGANVNTKDSSGLTPLKLALGYQRKEVAAFLRERGGVETVVPAAVPPKAVPVVVPPLAPPIQAAPVTAPTPALPIVPAMAPKPAPAEPRVAARPASTNKSPEVMNPVLFPIHDAAEVGDVEQVKALLKAWPELLEAPDEKGVTPLHIAAANGRKEVAEALLARRANVALKTKLGWTPLHFAAGKGDPATVALLLAYRAPVNAKTPMDITPLHLAVREGRTEAARLLLEQKAEVNQHDKGTGATPLHLAAESGSSPLVELLLAHGAEVNALNTAEETPLTLAATAGHSSVVELLRKRGGQDPKNRPLSPLEQSLVTFYEGVDRTFRTGSVSEKKRAVLSMIATKSDVQKIFPSHASQAWKVVDQLNREIKTALDRGFKDAAREAPLGKIMPAPPSAYVQQCQAKGWLAADVPIYTLVVNKQGGKIAADTYCFVNQHWVPLPPLDRIFQE